MKKCFTFNAHIRHADRMKRIRHNTVIAIRTQNGDNKKFVCKSHNKYSTYLLLFLFFRGCSPKGLILGGIFRQWTYFNMILLLKTFFD